MSTTDLSQIVPNLFISNGDTALEHGHLFDMVINCTPHVPFPPNVSESVTRLVRIPVDDDPADSSVLASILTTTPVLATMHSCLSQQKRVLVHCQMGQQRSPAVVACYLVVYHSMNPQEAVAYIRRQRPAAFFFGSINLAGAIDHVYVAFN